MLANVPARSCFAASRRVESLMPTRLSLRAPPPNVSEALRSAAGARTAAERDWMKCRRRMRRVYALARREQGSRQSKWFSGGWAAGRSLLRSRGGIEVLHATREEK